MISYNSKDQSAIPRTEESRMYKPFASKLLGGLFIAALFFTACGNEPVPITAAVPAAADDTIPAPAAPSEDSASGLVAVTSGESDLGEILIGSNGLAVYGFTNDANATSVCYGTCAEAWPPVLVSDDWTVAPGLDSGVFNAVARDDGQLQLVAGKWPLYFFAGDTVPTDINGQGSGDVWFVVGSDGSLVTDAPEASTDDATERPVETAPIVGVATTPLGDALVDESGFTLYGFLNDMGGEPSCENACADAWPPLFVESAELPADLDSTVFSVSERPDGTFQLNAGVWPLYRFAGDAAAGDVNGQGSGEVWFVTAPDGGLIMDGDSALSSGDDDY